MIDAHERYQRGNLYLVNLDPFKGSEQGGKRPVVVLSNNVGNLTSTTLNVAPLTTQKDSGSFPTHVRVKKSPQASERDSVVLVEQITTIDKCRVITHLGRMSHEDMRRVELALLIQLSLTNPYVKKLVMRADRRLRELQRRSRRRMPAIRP